MVDIALIGAGRIGKIHGGNLARQPGMRLKYVCDAVPQAASERAANLGAAVADLDRIFSDAAVQAVAIASSTDTHAGLILRAATARKAIFCEKPVDLDLGRAREVQAAVAKARVPCLIGFQRRYDPTFAALKRRLDAGEIGEVEVIAITSRDPAPPPIAYIERSGGIFKDQLIHDFDVCRWILGDEAQTVYAAASCLVDPAIAKAGDADTTAVTIRTRKGRLCQINTSRRPARRGEPPPHRGERAPPQRNLGGHARALLPGAVPDRLRRGDDPLRRGAARRGCAPRRHRGRDPRARDRRGRHAVGKGGEGGHDLMSFPRGEEADMALASRTAARTPRGARPRHANVGAFLAVVAAEYESLPKQLRAIARYAETNRARMVVTRITDVAAACAVQPSAVTRFAQRFGFSGYSELQALFRKAFSDGAAPGANYTERIRTMMAG